MTPEQYVPKILELVRIGLQTSAQFPYDRNKKPSNKKPHIRDFMFRNTQSIIVAPGIEMFEYGDEEAEGLVPHYHILEDAKTIRNRGKGTKQTKGSQRLIADRSKRDYSVTATDSKGRVFQEYRKGFKPGRRNYNKVTNMLASKRESQTPQSKSTFRYNIHYAYIERILQEVTPIIASGLGLTLESYRGLTLPLNETGE
jgi:hypothetical protein